MARYIVNGYLTVGCFKEIEADSENEAREKALDLSVPSLCWQCESAGDSDESAWSLNGIDDPPEDCIQSIELAKTQRKKK